MMIEDPWNFRNLQAAKGHDEVMTCRDLTG
jgi:hypothetical protein